MTSSLFARGFHRVSSICFLDRVRLGNIRFFACQPCECREVLLQGEELLLRESLNIDEAVAGALESRDKLVQLQMDRQRVLVLRTLDEKHHQERDNGCSRIDHELPCVGETESGPKRGPYDDGTDGAGERVSAPSPTCHGAGGSLQVPDSVRLFSHLTS